MAVHIRFSRIGTTNRPVFRIVATDSRKRRDGAFLDNLGTYDPVTGSVVAWNQEKFTYWIGVGAQLSDSVSRVYKKQQKATA